MLKVAVIDYDAGNTLSVTRALEKVGARVDLTPDPGRVARADAVVLPGVGAFGDCMKKLRARGMDAPRRRLTVGAGLVIVIGALFVTLPAAPSTDGFPFGVLWAFRLSSFGTQLVFWTGLGLLFGVLCERAGRKGVTA